MTPRIRFPDAPRTLSLGVGFDMPWGDPRAWAWNGVTDVPAEPLITFLGEHQLHFSHLFTSWQPRSRSHPAIDDYVGSYRELFRRLPHYTVRALHHTALNLAAVEAYDRSSLLAFTNDLVRELSMRWVNEDLGLWSLGGRRLPYPLPPYLTEQGLSAAIANVAEVQAALAVPLVVEFPGWSSGHSLCVGPMHAFDFFRRVAEETGSPVNLDVGHLLSYQWWCGRRGRALHDGLDRLPLEHCFEIHLAGCEIAGEDFIDSHEGVLIDAQLELLEWLVTRCPNLRAITFEDPRFDGHGTPTPGTAASLARLQASVARCLRAAPRAPAGPVASSLRQARRLASTERGPIAAAHAEAVLLDRTLERLLRSRHAREAWVFGERHEDTATDADAMAALRRPQLEAVAALMRRGVLTRCHRGTGTLVEAFPRTLEAWRALHAEDDALDELMARFLDSEAYAAHGDLPFGRTGSCLEEAFFTFCEASAIGSPQEREAELLAAVGKALAVTRDPAFVVPAAFRPCARGHFAVSSRSEPVLHAALFPAAGVAPAEAGAPAGAYVTGPLTPFIADLLIATDSPQAAAARHGATDEATRQTLVELRRLGLLPERSFE
jgi:uncharacterized protein (UPF0276 family)